ncbi:hypothetical protein CXG81DRAFT_24496 [Caulochytrium protostelioides]|uniref:Uncharacterized protein n=1 Tax=Caulochytrium protostelioides TaxID=1555241 RepID=A0A4P9XBT5_9FUNG|nr:hypothetical protein CXG81DRAFT_24496 [Caulochytrium protostelioides]|eukprot:RKP02897.1 hypothetical protein CXG81DRAFT_24496 [Caulochytrium protostelioides]
MMLRHRWTARAPAPWSRGLLMHLYASRRPAAAACRPALLGRRAVSTATSPTAAATDAADSTPSQAPPIQHPAWTLAHVTEDAALPSPTDPSLHLIYRSPLGSTLSLLKRVSLVSSALAWLCVPAAFITLSDMAATLVATDAMMAAAGEASAAAALEDAVQAAHDAPNIPVIAASISISCLMATSSTALLTYVVRPYVTRLWIQTPASSASSTSPPELTADTLVYAERLDLLGRRYMVPPFPTGAAVANDPDAAVHAAANTAAPPTPLRLGDLRPAGGARVFAVWKWTHPARPQHPEWFYVHQGLEPGPTTLTPVFQSLCEAVSTSAAGALAGSRSRSPRPSSDATIPAARAGGSEAAWTDLVSGLKAQAEAARKQQQQQQQSKS